MLRRTRHVVLAATSFVILALTACTDDAGVRDIAGLPQFDCVDDSSFNYGKQCFEYVPAFPYVSAGGNHTCVLKADGTVICWGAGTTNTGVNPHFGQAIAPAGTFTQLALGHTHSCGVKTDGTLACWGKNDDGQAEAHAGTFIQVSAGGGHNCAVKNDGTVDCWGHNFYLQGSDPDGTFTQVDAGFNHNCGVRTDGTVYCWGRDDAGQATAPSGTFVQVSSGGAHSCGVRTDGTVTCWGISGSTTPPTGTFVQVSTGHIHTCGVKTDGTVACWGGPNLDGEATPPGGTFVQVSAGGQHTCGVKTNGGVVCWGEDDYGKTAVPSELAGVTTTSTTLSISPITQQYSDSVTLTASVSPSTATGSVEFFIQNGADSTSLGTVAVAAGSASRKLQITAAAGASTYKAFFTATGQYASSGDSENLTVTPENATIGYAAGNVTALQVSSAGGSLNANALTLAFTVKEQEPDAAVSPGKTGIGTITNAALAVTLTPLGAGSPVALACTAGSVTGTGYAATRSFTCTNSTPIAVNTYEVKATVNGDYFTSEYADAFTVFDPSLGFASGGGSFLLDGDKVNFGFTMKYNKGGTNLQGNLIVVRHYPDGTVSRLKSNALAGLALGADASIPMGWTSFTGKASYTKWDATAGVYVTAGNQSFVVYAEDRNNPGTGIDQIWLGAPGTLAMPGTLATAKSNMAELTSGGIAVPHKAGKK